MNKAKTLVVQFEDWGHFKNRVTKALKNKTPSIAKKNTLVFGSVTEYQAFMTGQKLAILAVIVNKHPTSIYQLAQVVDRDFANVQRDCVALAAHGFIELEESGTPRNPRRSACLRLQPH